MKRKTVSFLTFVLVAVTFAFVFIGCAKDGKVKAATIVNTSENLLVIRVDEAQGGATLYDAMCMLRENGEMDFVSEASTYGESLVSIDGKANAADWSWYWASYTTDAENGTFAFNRDGQDYYYAAAGISMLEVKEGALYMFEYTEYVYEG